MAGTGELGDMLSHRLDYGHHLIGPFARVSAMLSRVWDSRIDAAGVSIRPTSRTGWPVSAVPQRGQRVPREHQDRGGAR